MKNRVLTALVTSSLLLSGGCHRASPPETTGSNTTAGAEAEPRTAQITVWSSGYEIFAEHTPPIVERATRFITHVSDLQSGMARTNGPLLFLLRQGETLIEHPQAAPDRPGIYIPAISFPAAGEWRITILISGLTNATVELGTVNVYGSEAAAAQAEYPEPPEGIPFLKEQQWRIQAKTEVATRRTLNQRVALHATIVPAPGSKISVHSPLAGRVLPEDAVTLGASVKKGDLLAWIEPSFNEFTAKIVDAQAEALQAKLALDQARATYDRTRALHEQQAKSRRELQEAELALRTAEAAFDAATTVQQLYLSTGAAFQDGRLRVALNAPIDGVVDKIAAHIGERIHPDQPLFTILDPNAALIEAQVPASQATRIRPEIGAVLQVESEDEFVTFATDLQFLAMGRELHPITHMLPLTYEFPIKNKAIPLGALGTLFVSTGQSTEALAIPSRAIVEEEGAPLAFVQVSGETFQKRHLKLGFKDGEWREVHSGVAPGERVVTDGAYALLLSTKSGTLPAHGHAH